MHSLQFGVSILCFRVQRLNCSSRSASLISFSSVQIDVRHASGGEQTVGKRWLFVLLNCSQHPDQRQRVQQRFTLSPAALRAVSPFLSAELSSLRSDSPANSRFTSVDAQTVGNARVYKDKLVLRVDYPRCVKNVHSLSALSACSLSSSALL